MSTPSPGGAGGTGLEPPGRPGPSLDARDDMPPIGKTWPRLYAFVVLFLAAQVILYYFFTKAFE